VSAAASGRLGKLGLAGFGLWCAIFAASFWPHNISAGEVLSIEVKVAETRSDLKTQQAIIFVKVSEESKRLIAEMTQKNIGRTAEFRVDGRVVMKPVIREPLLAGVFEISGRFDMTEAKDIAKRLSSGTKIEVELVSD
jgi:preprotein translocase subunit SecD